MKLFEKIWSPANDFGQDGTKRRSTLATTFLATVLVVALLGAQGLVSSRNTTIVAAENGKDLIDKVSGEGLDGYLPPEPAVVGYLFEHDGKPAGFELIQNPIGPDNDGFMTYRIYRLFSGSQVSCRFSIHDTLQIYHFEETREENAPASLTQKTTLYYNYGLFWGKLEVAGQSPYATQAVNVHRYTSGRANLVPGVLLDLFIALSLEKKFDDGVALSVATSDLDQLGQFAEQECSIEPIEEIPTLPGVAGIVHNAARVDWLKPEFGLEPFYIKQQEYYFDADNRLLWEKSVLHNGQTIIRRRADLAEVESAFPEAKTILEKRRSNGQQDAGDERLTL